MRIHLGTQAISKSSLEDGSTTCTYLALPLWFGSFTTNHPPPRSFINVYWALTIQQTPCQVLGNRWLLGVGHNLRSGRGCECPEGVTYSGDHKDEEREVRRNGMEEKDPHRGEEQSKSHGTIGGRGRTYLPTCYTHTSLSPCNDNHSLVLQEGRKHCHHQSQTRIHWCWEIRRRKSYRTLAQEQETGLGLKILN